MPLARSLRFLGAFCGALLLAGSGAAQTAPATAEPPREVHNLMRSTADRVESDGTVTRRERFRVQILTAGGLAQYSQVGVAFSEANEQATLELLQVDKPDGRRLDLLSSAPTDIAPLFPTELPIYSDLRLLRAAVPALGIGDRLEFESSVLSRPIAPGQVWLEMGFAEAGEVDEQVYVLDTPSDSTLRVNLREGLKAQFEEEHRDGRWLRRWRIVASADPASPPVTPKPTNAAPDIQITTFRTWDEFGLWWASLAPPLVDDKVRAKALELTTGLSEPTARLRALHRYVAQEIRYLALPLGIGRYRAREPGEILSTELGDCKDKFRLLASLAQSVGIAVDPVLIFASAKRAFVEEAPSPLQFDHVIARAHLGANEIWMDPTAELVPMGSLPRTSRGRPGVALVHTGKKSGKDGGGVVATALVTTPASLAEPPSITAEINGSIATSGLLRARVRWTFSGDEELFRAVWKYGDEKLRRAALDNMRREWSKEAKIGSSSNSDPNDVDRPFWVEYEVELAMSASVWRKAWEFWVPAPFTSTPAPPDAADAAATSEPPPLELESLSRQTISARIELPEGVHASPPVPMSSRREFAEFRSDYRLEGRTLVLERELSFKVDSIASADFAALRDLRKLVASDYRQEFSVAAAPALAPQERTAEELASDCWEAVEARRDVEAERICRQAIVLDPRLPMVWNSLGIALERQDRLDEAKAAYQKQIEVDPAHEHAYANLGLLAWTANDLPAAEVLFRKQVEVAPMESSGYARLGRFLFESERLDEAESLLRRAAKLDPDTPLVLEDLLELEARRGRFEAFAAMLLEHPQLGRDPGRLTSNLVLLSRQETTHFGLLAGWLQEGAADAERQLAALDRPRPSRAEVGAIATLIAVWEAQARIAIEEGRMDDALTLLNAVIGIGHSPSAVAAKADVLRVRGDSAAADFHLAMAAELDRPGAAYLEKRLAAAVPDSETRQRLTAKAQAEAWDFRSQSRRFSRAASEQGEVWMLFDAGGKLIGASPVSGSPTKSIVEGLLAEPIRLETPSANRSHLAIKALAYCTPSGDCTLTLEPPGQTWMSMKDER